MQNWNKSQWTYQLHKVDQAGKCSRMQTRNVALSEEKKYFQRQSDATEYGKIFLSRCKLSCRPGLKHLRDICFRTSNCRGMESGEWSIALWGVCMQVKPKTAFGAVAFMYNDCCCHVYNKYRLVKGEVNDTLREYWAFQDSRRCSLMWMTFPKLLCRKQAEKIWRCNRRV